MAERHSAGIALYRRRPEGVQVLLGHMGGPIWGPRDTHAWSIPKGLLDPGETPEQAARREFTEELGVPVPPGDLVLLGDFHQASGKRVTAFALEGDLDPDSIRPGTFVMRWPRGSGDLREFPELDRVAWFRLDEVGDRLIRGQEQVLDLLADHLVA
jgi:predicted NUDIX family NTP pyrophosphohydrolase